MRIQFSDTHREGKSDEEPRSKKHEDCSKSATPKLERSSAVSLGGSQVPLARVSSETSKVQTSHTSDARRRIV